MDYLETTIEIYRKAAESPDIGLCCTTTPVMALPELNIPKKMQDMNYGCGTTVNPGDLINNPKILYVGVGGGMELLQFSYFNRTNDGVIGVDTVDKMLEVCKKKYVAGRRTKFLVQKRIYKFQKGRCVESSDTR